MALQHRIKRMEATFAARSRPCPQCAGPSVVRIIPAPVASSIDEITNFAGSGPEDDCPHCGRRVVHRIPPPVPGRVAGLPPTARATELLAGGSQTADGTAVS